MSNKTRKPKWNGWAKLAPTTTKERNNMMKHCGKKCFLGTKKTFPICNKKTCKINRKGIQSAFIRAMQWHHNNIAKKAKKMLLLNNN